MNIQRIDINFVDNHSARQFRQHPRQAMGHEPRYSLLARRRNDYGFMRFMERGPYG